MLAQFSDQAHTVMQQARQQSERLRHYYVGVEHLFLALCETATPPLREALLKSGLDPVIALVRAALVPAQGETIWGTGIIQTPRLTRVLRHAGVLSAGGGQPAVMPHHLMLAVAADPKSLPMRLCARAQVDLARFRRSVQTLAEAEVAIATVPAAPSIAATPTLDRYGRDLTALASMRRLDPVIGREREIEQLATILRKRTQNNVLILGEAGTGKTHLVEGLALALAFPASDAMKRLAPKRVIEIDVNALIAGTSHRGDFEARLEAVLRDASNPDVILFIDEFHVVVSAGAAEGAHGAGQILKPYLSRGEIRCIGATTTDEYERFIARDQAFARRFETMVLREPTADETVEILEGLVDSYERSHQVHIEEDALHACVEYGGRFFPGRRFPAKAIDLLDVACAQASLGSADRVAIRRQDVAQVVFQKTGAPLTHAGAKEWLAELSGRLEVHVKGQPEVVDATVTIIRNAMLGLMRSGRPQGVLLACGPAGVGKTELARAVARELFQSDAAFIRLNMADYSEPNAMALLIGAPPGYVGHEEGGRLTDAVRRNPLSVVLFEDIDRAHPDVRTLVTRICDEGRLLDAQRRAVSFANTFVFMTINLGSSEDRPALGFGGAALAAVDGVPALAPAQVEQAIGSDLCGRVDQVLLFKPLTAPALRQIIDKEIADLHERDGFKQRRILLRLHEDAYGALIAAGSSPQRGARDLKRTIERTIVTPLGGYLASTDLPAHAIVIATIADGATVFHTLRSVGG